MARRPLSRIDGEAPEGAPPAVSPPPRPSRPPPRLPPPGHPLAAHPLVRRAVRLAPPQVWLGAGCVLALVVLLAVGGGPPETRRSPLDRVAADSQGPVVATLQVPGGDLRPVRQICDDQGLPAELCARSAACAGPAPSAAGSGPRLVRLFLRAPSGGGCG